MNVISIPECADTSDPRDFGTKARRRNGGKERNLQCEKKMKRGRQNQHQREEENVSTIVEDFLPNPVEQLPTIEDIDKELSKKSLRHFARFFWHKVHAQEFIPGWHLDAICDHLEAVHEGNIRKLIINIPPRFTKSTLVSVMFPAWEWLQDPGYSYLNTSYAEHLTTRDSVRCRRILTSPQYEEIILSDFPDFHLTTDQNVKRFFMNSHHGYRMATTVLGTGTGEGGDRVLVDDPHNIVEGESETKRREVIRWWSEVMPTRINDFEESTFIIIMQRSHEEDLTGYELEQATGFDHLCLPLEYPGKNRVVSSIGFEDPRKRKGELLCPARMSREAVERMKQTMTEYAWSAQMDQNPTPRGGEFFKIDNVAVVDKFPGKIVRTVRYWDKAGTDGIKNPNAAWSVGTKMSLLDSGKYLIHDVKRGRWSSEERERIIRSIAEADGIGAEVWVEQEPGSGGKESAENTIRKLAGFRVYRDLPKGDKTMRADPFSVQVNNGNVIMLRAEWNKEYLKELEGFPFSKFKDQVDSSSGAFSVLTRKRKIIK